MPDATRTSAGATDSAPHLEQLSVAPLPQSSYTQAAGPVTLQLCAAAADRCISCNLFPGRCIEALHCMPQSLVLNLSIPQLLTDGVQLGKQLRAGQLLCFQMLHTHSTRCSGDNNSQYTDTLTVRVVVTTD
jgi:hypothetical protein